MSYSLPDYLSRLTTLFLVMLAFSCNSSLRSFEPGPYEPVDQQLFETVLNQDKKFFDAYNNCDLKTQADMYDENIEFFHDKGGLATSKIDILESTEKNICGKVTRSLVEGSVEVYPIKDYGAVQIGYHKFFNSEEPNAPSLPSRFITIWKNYQGTWTMAKVISLHAS